MSLEAEGGNEAGGGAERKNGGGGDEGGGTPAGKRFGVCGEIHPPPELSSSRSLSSLSSGRRRLANPLHSPSLSFLPWTRGQTHTNTAGGRHKKHCLLPPHRSQLSKNASSASLPPFPNRPLPPSALHQLPPTPTNFHSHQPTSTHTYQIPSLPHHLLAFPRSLLGGI